MCDPTGGFLTAFMVGSTAMNHLAMAGAASGQERANNQKANIEAEQAAEQFGVDESQNLMDLRKARESAKAMAEFGGLSLESGTVRGIDTGLVVRSGYQSGLNRDRLNNSLEVIETNRQNANASIRKPSFLNTALQIGAQVAMAGMDGGSTNTIGSRPIG